MAAPSSKPTPYTPKSLPVMPGGGLPYTKRELDRLSETLTSTQALLATEATVTPAMDGVASVGTSLIAARQDHVHPTDTALLGTATPLMDGTAAAGSSLLAARQDHVHPTDTALLGTATPLVDGTGSAGTSLLAARQDHVHPSNAPSPATATPLADGTAAVGTSLLYARQDHVHPQSGWKTLSSYTPSAASSQAIPLPSGFRCYRLRFYGLTVSTAAFLAFQASTDGGSTYITGTDYAQVGFYNNAATGVNPFDQGETYGLLTLTLAASTIADGVYDITPGSASQYATCNGSNTGNINGGSWYTGQFSNIIVTTAAINQLKVYPSTGTFSGTLILEGLP